MGYKSVPMKTIEMLCNSFRLEQSVVLERMKHLTDNFLEIIWANKDKGRIKDMGWEINNGKGNDLALAYIRDFDPYRAPLLIHNEMLTMLEAKWLIKLVEITMERVKGFPMIKVEHIKILNNLWSDAPVSEYECWKSTNLGKTTYSTRKNEAILLFGSTLWGLIIPGLSQKGLCVAESSDPGIME